MGEAEATPAVLRQPRFAGKSRRLRPRRGRLQGCAPAVGGGSAAGIRFCGFPLRGNERPGLGYNPTNLNRSGLGGRSPFERTLPVMDDLLIPPAESPAAFLDGPDVATTNGSNAAAAAAAMIVFEEVRKVYEPDVVALQRASFVIEKGEFVFVVGPSGSGKSTIIRLLLKELEPTSGRIIVGGRDLTRLKRSKVPLLRRNVGCVFQDFKLLRDRSAFENVAYALRVQGESSTSIRRKVPEVLALVGLAHKAGSRPDELSGGEQQRVSIARAVVNHPPLLICDEPTGNLDPDTSVGIMQLLHRINTAGTTILMVTHDREMVDKMRKRVIALDSGKVVRDERRGGYETE